jgi:hypothetical protein
VLAASLSVEGIFSDRVQLKESIVKGVDEELARFGTTVSAMLRGCSCGCVGVCVACVCWCVCWCACGHVCCVCMSARARARARARGSARPDLSGPRCSATLRIRP